MEISGSKEDRLKNIGRFAGLKIGMFEEREVPTGSGSSIERLESEGQRRSEDYFGGGGVATSRDMVAYVSISVN